MYDGQIIEEGAPDVIAASGKAREVYLGSGFTMG
jgi:ABC-type lipopolysaccharide export system ATPase subunit